MPEYDADQYDPPAPVARVTLRNPQTNAVLADQPLLIDTGADATLIPQAALVPLGLQPIAELSYELIAFDGTRSVASVADLDLIFLNRRFRGRYLLTHADIGVLGRDILNHLALLFDGPAISGPNTADRQRRPTFPRDGRPVGEATGTAVDISRRGKRSAWTTWSDNSWQQLLRARWICSPHATTHHHT
jgi:hypothetical protein